MWAGRDLASDLFGWDITNNAAANIAREWLVDCSSPRQRNHLRFPATVDENVAKFSQLLVNRIPDRLFRHQVLPSQTIAVLA
jgi:hypothetical protein